MSATAFALPVLAALLLSPSLGAQCTERFQQYDGSPSFAMDFGMIVGEEFGIRVDGIPAAHFPIEVVAVGLEWMGATNPGSIQVYPTGYPATFEDPLYSHAPATAVDGTNVFDVTPSGPFTLSAQPFVVTWRYGIDPVGYPAADGNGCRADVGTFHFVYHPGPGWFDACAHPPAGGDLVFWIEYVPAATGTAFCAGDGTAGDCPCGAAQNGAPGEGCRHSFGNGGVLSAFGEASVAADTLSLGVRGVPATTTVLFFQYSTPAAPSPFGDGLLCAGGPVVRLSAAIAQQGEACIGPTLVQPLSVLGGIPPGGGDRHYQAWYRNQMSFCTPAVFNLTAGVSISWAP